MIQNSLKIITFIIILLYVTLPQAIAKPIKPVGKNQTTIESDIQNQPLNNNVVNEKRENIKESFEQSKIYGANLFTGTYTQASFTGFNPNYIISVGDVLIIRIWGAFTHEEKYVVDPQGNIFLPQIGPVHVLGVASGNLSNTVEAAAKKVFENNVFVYANLDTAQPVKIFVTGGVSNPGLYGGLSSDSILSYLDKANGIHMERGSFIDIKVLRNNKIYATFNLYDFLSQGRIKLVQLIDGDVIFVGSRKNIVTVKGMVSNESEFEFCGKTTASHVIKLAQPKPSATNFTLIRTSGEGKKAFHYLLCEAQHINVQNGDEITLTSEKKSESIVVKVEQPGGEDKFFAIPTGFTLKYLVSQIPPNARSQIKSMQLFRKSVAIRQKEAIDTNLTKLESLAYTTTSPTNDSAVVRSTEAQLISKFVAKARLVQPKGQVILEQCPFCSDLILEDGDVIFIPSQTSLVLVQGEVNFPTALTYKPRYKVRDYICSVGGFTNIANTNQILLIKRSGRVIQSKLSGSNIEPGDEVFVLPKIDSKSLEVTKTLSQILFHLAIVTKTVIGL